MTRKYVLLSNDYHDTQCVVSPDSSGYININQMRRAKKILCGIPGCTCSGNLGTRGPQDVEIEIDYDLHGSLCAIVHPLGELLSVQERKED